MTVSRLRHSLSEESVRANTILGSWARIDHLVPEKETVKFLKKKSHSQARDDEDEDEVEFVGSNDE